MHLIKIRSLALLCGMASLLMGLIVIYGWYIGSNAIVQINPSFAPMQYNTALGFFLSGFALLGLSLNKNLIGKIFGLVITTLGITTLSQYIFVTDFGLDQFFMDHAVTTKTSHPGHMAPNTALCFSLVGLSCLFLNYNSRITASLSAAILVLSILAFLGYLIGEESIYGWGTLTRMAIHTAIGFVIVGLGLSILIKIKLEDQKLDWLSFSPVFISTIVVIITFFSWYATKETTQERNKEYFETLVGNTQDALSERYRFYEQSLWGGLGLFYASKSVERSEWKNYVDAMNIQTYLPGINGIGFIEYVSTNELENFLADTRKDGFAAFNNHPETTHDDKFVIKYIEPENKNEAAIGLDIGFEKNRRAAAELARDKGVPALTEIIELVQDNKKQAGFLLLLPVYDTKDTPPTVSLRRQHFQGWVYAPFIGTNFLSGLSNISQNQLTYTVYDDTKANTEKIIYTSKNQKHIQKEPFEHQTQIKIANQTWTIDWATTKYFTPPANKSLAAVVFIFGSLFSIFLYFLMARLVRQKEIIAAEVDRQTTIIKDNLDRQEKLVQELVNSNENLERFAYIASHDLQEPIRMISNFTNLLKEEYGKKFDKEANQYMKYIAEASERMQDLVSDLLEYSRVGSEEAGFSNFDSKEQINIVLENLNDPIKETDAKIIIGTMPEVHANPVRFSRLMQNLIGNGIKYRASDRTPEIKVNAEDKNDHWLFSIEDNGIGIKDEYQDQIFVIFKRLHTKSEYSGTGIGLAICKKIVESFRGKIWIESEYGSGSTFYFTLPKE